MAAVLRDSIYRLGSSLRKWSVGEVVFGSAECQLEPVRHTDLVIYGRQMIFHRLITDREFLCDTPVRITG